MAKKHAHVQSDLHHGFSLAAKIELRSKKTKKERIVKRYNIFLVIFLSFLLGGCSMMNVYRNAYEAPDREGKETWALVSAEEGPVGRILISPRPRDNKFKAAVSANNMQARSQILLEPGVRDINVYAFNGGGNAIFSVSDIAVEENEEYVVRYNVDGNRITAWVENADGEKVSE
ncbi:hypothetical protein CWE14_11745 [Aliidiomarina soli]|uniref:Uncharacterized protein n=1 Tax=Aliidiomarina soli TaxID=1928574 RepID=A0A432WE50_9GAMM|nr:hypothetical protein CWE14_11745 [Aliidiomarina soli]